MHELTETSAPSFWSPSNVQKHSQIDSNKDFNKIKLKPWELRVPWQDALAWEKYQTSQFASCLRRVLSIHNSLYALTIFGCMFLFSTDMNTLWESYGTNVTAKEEGKTFGSGGNLKFYDYLSSLH